MTDKEKIALAKSLVRLLDSGAALPKELQQQAAVLLVDYIVHIKRAAEAARRRK